MAMLECGAVREAGVTLVEARVSAAERRRVVLEVTHASPVWPPRREGVPADGWSIDGWTGIVPDGGSVALGYATSDPVDVQPLQIVECGPPEDDEAITARAVLRSLGDASPPRDAIEAGEWRRPEAEDGRRTEPPAVRDRRAAVERNPGQPPRK